MNKILFEESRKKQILKGAELLERVVGATMGARGKTIALRLGNAAPVITKDGITVAEYVFANNLEEQTGIDMVRNASRSANAVAGDGSTAAVVLAYNLLKEGVTALENTEITPTFFKRGIDKAMRVVLDEIDRLSIKDFNVLDVAKISANGDAEIAKIINEAFELVGVDGIIRVDAADSNKSILTREEGMKFNKGFAHPLFVTNMEKGIAEHVNPLLLLIDGDMMEGKWLVPYFKAALIAEKPLVIIANDFGENILGMCNLARKENGLSTLLIKSPLYGDNRSAIMKDLAHMTGAKIISDNNANITRLGIAQRPKREAGNTMSDMEFYTNGAKKMLGSLNKIRSDRNDSTLYYDIDTDYINQLKKLLKTDDEFARERIAMLTGGVAVISIGGESDTEVGEIMARVEDSVNATRAALEEGIVAGGGIALLEARKAILKLELTDKSEDAGADALYKVLDKTFERILANADIKPMEVGNYPYGYDVNKMKIVDMIEAGIIDPAKVIKESLRNGGSVVGTVLSSGALVIYAPEN